MAKKKSPGRGGAREGAGRKITNPEGPTVTTAFSIPQSLLDSLDALAKSKGWSKSQAVTEAIRGLLKRSKSRS
jgi:hypothetical protein